MFSLARAHEAFTEDGQLAQPDLQQRLADTVSAFVHFVEADVRYVCLQRCWYEFPANIRRRRSPIGPKANRPGDFRVRCPVRP